MPFARATSVYGTCFAQVRFSQPLYELPQAVQNLTSSEGDNAMVYRMVMPDGQPLTEPVNLQISIRPVTDNIPSVEELVDKDESGYPTLENLVQVLRLLKTLSAMNTDAFVSAPWWLIVAEAQLTELTELIALLHWLNVSVLEPYDQGPKCVGEEEQARRR